MPPRLNLKSGSKYGRLTVVTEVGRTHPRYDVLYRCRCDCGRTKIVAGWRLKAGSTKTCGCDGRGGRRTPRA